MIMKAKILTAAMFVLMGFGLQSCTTDDGDIVIQEQTTVDVPEPVQKLFKENFPTAQNATWQQKNDMLQVAFSVVAES